MFERELIGFLELVLYKYTIAQYHFYLFYICKLRVVSNSLSKWPSETVILFVET